MTCEVARFGQSELKEYLLGQYGSNVLFHTMGFTLKSISAVTEFQNSSNEIY